MAVEPYESEEKASLFRVDYLKQGFLPVWLVITNNSDQPISLREARILFETATGERLQAAEPEDVERRMAPKFRRDADLGAPLPPLHGGSSAIDQQIEADFQTFEFSALTVEAHTTRAGFLFYDISEWKNPLEGAKLHLHKLRKVDGTELFYFEVPFDLYLRAKNAQMQ